MIKLILRILYAKKWYILLSAIICCAVASYTASRSSTFYVSKARVQLNLGDTDPLTGKSMGTKYAEAYFGTQIELTRDYNVIGRAVDLAGFINSPEVTATYLAAVPDRSIDMRRWMADNIASSAVSTVLPESSILEIQFYAASPAMATSMAELLRTAYIEQTLAGQQSEARRQAEWLQSEAQAVRARLTEAQKKKTDFERENGIIVSREGVSLDDIRVASQIAPPTPGRSTSTPLPTAPSAAALGELEARIASASATMGPNHPDMVQMRERQIALRNAVAEETSAIRASAAQPKQAEDTAPAAIQQAFANAEKNAQAKQLAADIALLEAQYQQIASRSAAVNMEVAAPNTGLTPLGPATIPEDPFFPNWPLLLGLSFGVGLVFGALTSLLLELLYLRVGSQDDLELEGVALLNARVPTSAPAPPSTSRFSRWISSLPQNVRSNRLPEEAAIN